MTISISQILTSVTFVVCTFAINGIARKAAGILVAVLSVLLIKCRLTPSIIFDLGGVSRLKYGPQNR